MRCVVCVCVVRVHGKSREVAGYPSRPGVARVGWRCEGALRGRPGHRPSAAPALLPRKKQVGFSSDSWTDLTGARGSSPCGRGVP